jgi:hypothetical protein
MRPLGPKRHDVPAVWLPYLDPIVALVANDYAAVGRHGHVSGIQKFTPPRPLFAQRRYPSPVLPKHLHVCTRRRSRDCTRGANYVTHVLTPQEEL